MSLSNTGRVDSSTTVQLYVRQLDQPDAPLRSLVALSKVHVTAGETVTVVLNTAAYGNTCAFCTVATDGTAGIAVGSRWAVSVGDGASDMFAPFNVTVV